jgi:hypothetical protein
MDDAYRECLKVFDDRRTKTLSRPHIKLPAVQWAFDHMPF